MSAPDPETVAQILADPAYAALCRAPWLPDPCNAPQVQAYTSPADLLLYGGAAGGGKTDLLLGLAVTAHERSVLFRRAYADLDGITQRLMEIFPDRRGYVASPHPKLQQWPPARIRRAGETRIGTGLAGPGARLHRLR